jgi:hypothetical protein
MGCSHHEGEIAMVMRLNETTFAWSRQREQAALLVAQDDQSDRAIAASCGMGKATLERWKQQPIFQARVAEHCAVWRTACLERGVADRRERIRALNERWFALQDIVDQRKAALTPEKLAASGLGSIEPGIGTGLMIRVIRSSKHGSVEEWQVDHGLLDAFLRIEKQAAQELGQWLPDSVDAGTTRDGGLDPTQLDRQGRPKIVAGNPARMSDAERIQALVALVAQFDSAAE